MSNFNPRGTERQKNNFSLSVGAVDLGAATLSTVAANVSGNASFGTGLASGIKWAATGASELTNTGPRSWLQSAANLTNSVAGLGSMGSTLAAHFTSSDSASAAGLGYFSAASWGVSALANTVKGAATAWTKKGRESASGGFQALSGLANVAAAGYSAAAAHSASQNDSIGAARNATISSALWMGGAALGIASTYVGRPQGRAQAAVHPEARPLTPDLEAGLHPPSAAGIRPLPAIEPVASAASGGGRLSPQPAPVGRLFSPPVGAPSSLAIEPSSPRPARLSHAFLPPVGSGASSSLVVGPPSGRATLSSHTFAPPVGSGGAVAVARPVPSARSFSALGTGPSQPQAQGARGRAHSLP